MQPGFQRPLNPIQSPVSPSEAFKLSAYWLQYKYTPLETPNATQKQGEMICGNWLPKPGNDRNGKRQRDSGKIMKQSAEPGRAPA
jgi:hypothetical protein